METAAPTKSHKQNEKKQKRNSTGSSQHNTSGGGASSADEFFIDVILARHARKLLTAGNLAQLGVFFAQFPDFQVRPKFYSGIS